MTRFANSLTVLTRCLWLLLLSIPGCSSIVVLTPEDLDADTSYSIVVSTRDSLQISFARGDYEVQADSLGRQVIAGKGKIYHGKDPQFKRFSGEVPIADIERITSARTNSFVYILMGTTAAVLLYFAFWGLHGRVGG